MTKTKRNRIIKCLIAMSITAVLGIGFTLAYLHDETETKQNVFTSNKKISIQLREPSWDGYQFTDLPGGDGTAAKPGISETDLEGLGVAMAQGYVPGQHIPKDPQVKNNGETADGISSYIALKVQYFDDQDQQVSYDTFKNNYLAEPGIEFNTNWTLIADSDDGSQIYFYNNILKVGEDTSKNPLFKEVPLSLGLEPKADGTLPKFEIKVTAYGIQSDNISAADAQAEMKNFVTK